MMQLCLFLSLLFLAIVVFYLLANLPRQRTPEATRWGLPHHFTIPVLSPFTSVVNRLYLNLHVYIRTISDIPVLLR